jgi:hypothetical protein
MDNIQNSNDNQLNFLKNDSQLDYLKKHIDMNICTSINKVIKNFQQNTKTEESDYNSTEEEQMSLYKINIGNQKSINMKSEFHDQNSSQGNSTYGVYEKPECFIGNMRKKNPEQKDLPVSLIRNTSMRSIRTVYSLKSEDSFKSKHTTKPDDLKHNLLDLKEQRTQNSLDTCHYTSHINQRKKCQMESAIQCNEKNNNSNNEEDKNNNNLSKNYNNTYKNMKSHYKFIIKLLDILNNEKEYGQIITWSFDGCYIEIKDQKKLVDVVLSNNFKHDNYSNFVRQLNMYNFKKERNYPGNGIIAYSNKYFIKGKEDLLIEIQRRSQNNQINMFMNSKTKDNDKYSNSKNMSKFQTQQQHKDQQEQLNNTNEILREFLKNQQNTGNNNAVINQINPSAKLFMETLEKIDYSNNTNNFNNNIKSDSNTTTMINQQVHEQNLQHSFNYTLNRTQSSTITGKEVKNTACNEEEDLESVKNKFLLKKINVLVNRMFMLENKVERLESTSEDLYSNNNNFSKQIDDKNYYINMLEGLVFYIVHNFLPSTSSASNLKDKYNTLNCNKNYFLSSGNNSYFQEKEEKQDKYNSNNINDLKLKKIETDYFDQPTTTLEKLTTNISIITDMNLREAVVNHANNETFNANDAAESFIMEEKSKNLNNSINNDVNNISNLVNYINKEKEALIKNANVKSFNINSYPVRPSILENKELEKPQESNNQLQRNIKFFNEFSYLNAKNTNNSLPDLKLNTVEPTEDSNKNANKEEHFFNNILNNYKEYIYRYKSAGMSGGNKSDNNLNNKKPINLDQKIIIDSKDKNSKIAKINNENYNEFSNTLSDSE